MSATSCPSREELLAYHCGELPEVLAGPVIAHVGSCTQCQAVLETFDDAHDTLVARLRQPAVESPYAAEPHGRELVARASALVPAGGGPGDELPEEPPVLRELGEYQLIEKLGEGGMGAVYKARQTKLKKTVALKVLPKDRMEDQRALARFEREMEAVGAVDHPNIVRAMDAREIDGVHFLVMEYVEGIDLSRLVHRLGPLPIPDACEIIRQAALGLQYAHEHGLIHRDIKPSNLMLAVRSDRIHAVPAVRSDRIHAVPAVRSDRIHAVPAVRGDRIDVVPPRERPDESGHYEPTVKILDLGLALFKRQEGPLGETTDTGQAMGTADYMAPEQAHDCHQVDIRADIYSLGCTLYKLLTGHAPFSGPEYSSNMAKMMAHVQEPVPPITARRDDVPEELIQILDRMLAKTPDERYATAGEVADALSSLALGETAGVRGQPVPGSDLAALASAALHPDIKTDQPAPSQVSTEEYQSSALAGTEPRPRKGLAGQPATARMGHRWRRVAACVVAAAAGLLGVMALVDLATDRGTPPRWQLETVAPREGVCCGVSWSRDGCLVACGGSPVVRVYDSKTRRLVHIFLGHTRPVTETAFSPDGNWLASSSLDGSVRLWNLETGKAGQVMGSLGPGLSVGCLAWSPDGERLAARARLSLVLLRVDGMRLVRVCQRELKSAPEPANSVSWSPDGEWLAAMDDKTVRVFTRDGEPWRTVEHAGSVSCVAWSPDAAWLAAGECLDEKANVIQVWDTATWKRNRVLKGHGDYIGDLSWSPDSRKLASASRDCAVKVWSLDGQPPRDFVGHWRPVLSVAWNEQGTWLASGGEDCTLRFWDPVKCEPGPVLGQVGVFITKLVPSPDGKWLATHNVGESETRLWTFDGRPAGILPGEGGGVKDVAWSPDAYLLAAASKDGTIRLWKIPDAGLAGVLKGHAGAVQSLSWSPDGKMVVSGSVDKTVRLWNVTDATLDRVLTDHAGAIDQVAWSPDGAHFLSLSKDRPDDKVRIWKADGSPGPRLEGDQGSVSQVQWSPDGQRFATCGFEELVRIWNVDDGRPGAGLAGDARLVSCVAWSPDGKWLAVGNSLGGDAGNESTVRLWSADGSPGPVIPVFGGYVAGVAWSPDGRWLAHTGDWSSSIRLWNGVGRVAGATLEGPFRPLKWLSWHPDGRHLIAAEDNGVIRYCDPQQAKLLSKTLLFADGQAAHISEGGQLTISRPKVEQEFVYVVEQTTGEFELYSPSDFRKLDLCPPQIKQRPAPAAPPFDGGKARQDQER